MCFYVRSLKWNNTAPSPGNKSEDDKTGGRCWLENIFAPKGGTIWNYFASRHAGKKSKQRCDGCTRRCCQHAIVFKGSFIAERGSVFWHEQHSRPQLRVYSLAATAAVCFRRHTPEAGAWRRGGLEDELNLHHNPTSSHGDSWTFSHPRAAICQTFETDVFLLHPLQQWKLSKKKGCKTKTIMSPPSEVLNK